MSEAARRSGRRCSITAGLVLAVLAVVAALGFGEGGLLRGGGGRRRCLPILARGGVARRGNVPVSLRLVISGGGGTTTDSQTQTLRELADHTRTLRIQFGRPLDAGYDT